MIVDSHVHVVSDDTERYPLRPSGVGSDWWRTSYPATDLTSDLDANEVAAAVVVQAVGPYGDDNRCLLDTVATSHRLVGVVALDGDDPRASDTLARLARQPNVRGVRLFAVGNPEPGWTRDARRAAELWRAAAQLDLTVVLTVFAEQLRALQPALETVPEATFAVDHCGFPDLSVGLRSPATRPLEALAALPHVHLKVTTHVLEGTHPSEGGPTGFVEWLADRYGPHRLLWGSDHPQSGRPYRECLALGRRAAEPLSDGARRAFFGGNAARLFGVTVEPTVEPDA